MSMVTHIISETPKVKKIKYQKPLLPYEFRIKKAEANLIRRLKKK
jgi:hypothetical protein